MKLKALGIIHENCAYCEIDGKYVVEGCNKRDIFGNEEISIKVLDSYEISNTDDWHPKWEYIRPLDKDEITSLHLIYDDQTVRVRVPFNDLSRSGAYCLNEYSTEKHNDGTIEILWSRQNKDLQDNKNDCE